MSQTILAVCQSCGTEHKASQQCPKCHPPKHQKVVITLTDTGDGKTFKASMAFEPDISADAQMTPAVSAAMQFLEMLSKEKKK